MNHVYIQARVGSKRFPKKILKEVYGKTIIELIIERVKKIKNIDKIIVVTGPKENNFELLEKISKLGIEFFCGSEENILDRFYKASCKYKSKNIIRITADCPFLDFNLINHELQVFSKKNVDILCNNRIRTFPHGLDFEIFTNHALKIAWEDNLSQFENYEEFKSVFMPPTKYMLEKKKFKKFDLKNKEDFSNIRITLDYKEDFELIRKIYEELYENNPNFGLKEILDLFKKYPELLKINKKWIENSHNLEIEK